MTKSRHSVASRERGHRLLRWLLLAALGGVGGLFLGEMTVDNMRGAVTGSGQAYTGLSANPGALTPAGLPQPPCLDCPDRYGVAVRMRTERAARMDHAFRELGAVDEGVPPVEEPVNDYRYGGRFPEAVPEVSTKAVPVEALTDEVADSPLPDDPRP
jgi:hypothetical protein